MDNMKDFLLFSNMRRLGEVAERGVPRSKIVG